MNDHASEKSTATMDASTYDEVLRGGMDGRYDER